MPYPEFIPKNAEADRNERTAAENILSGSNPFELYDGHKDFKRATSRLRTVCEQGEKIIRDRRPDLLQALKDRMRSAMSLYRECGAYDSEPLGVVASYLAAVGDEVDLIDGQAIYQFFRYS